MEGGVEVGAVGGEVCGEGVGDEFFAFDVFIEFAVAVDDAEGVPHFMEDGGEEIVFAIGGTIGGSLEILPNTPTPQHPYSLKLTRILWCAIDEPADSVGIVVDADGGGVRATELVVACDGGFG